MMRLLATGVRAGRAGYLPPLFARLHPRRGTPIGRSSGLAIFGLGVVWFGDTNQAITLAAVGATLLYVLSMISLFVLRDDRAPSSNVPITPVLSRLSRRRALASYRRLVAVLWSAPQPLSVWVCSCSAGLYYRAVARPASPSSRVFTPCVVVDPVVGQDPPLGLATGMRAGAFVAYWLSPQQRSRSVGHGAALPGRCGGR